MIEHKQPSYSDVMRELDIEIINPNNPYICNSDLVNFQKSGKTGLKIQNLRGLRFDKSCAYFLRYRDKFFYLKIIPLNSTKTEKGGIYT